MGIVTEGRFFLRIPEHVHQSGWQKWFMSYGFLLPNRSTDLQDAPGWKISMNGHEQYHADELTTEWIRYSHLMLVSLFFF